MLALAPFAQSILDALEGANWLLAPYALTHTAAILRYYIVRLISERATSFNAAVVPCSECADSIL